MTKQPVVLITGATSGIGKELVKRLLKGNYRVIATGRSVEKLAQLAEELGSAKLYIRQLDVTDSRSIRSAANWVTTDKTLGNVEILINNAGYSQPGPVVEVEIDSIRRQYETNVFGLVEVTQAFLPQLKQSKGMILNVSSTLGRMTMPFNTVYGSTKYALEALSDGMRIELAPFGIQVVVVEPGPINTNFLDTAMSNLSPEKRKHQLTGTFTSGWIKSSKAI